MEITYTTEDKSMRIKLVYITKQRLTLYRGNKTYPTVTQCLMYKNDLLYSFAEVVKHREDKNNAEYAMKLVTKKVLEKMPFKCVRKSIWEVLNVSLKF